jgi:hypothetical protein
VAKGVQKHRRDFCPAGRARCARGGHFVACVPCLAGTSDRGPPVGRDQHGRAGEGSAGSLNLTE